MSGSGRGLALQSRARRTWLLRALFTFCFAALSCLSGCHQVPPGRDAVSRVRIDGAPDTHEEELESGLATQPSPRLLGLFGGVYEYELLDRAALERDLERIERQLRRRGYYEAKVRAARIVRIGENRVRVEIEVIPGEAVRIRDVQTSGLADLPFEVSTAATRALALRQGEPFDEDAFERAQEEVARALADRGYAFAEVEGKARVDLVTHSADLAFTVRPGKLSVLGPVRIEGLRQLPEGPVRAALQLEEGDLYSRSELDLARAALLELRAFSRVELIPQLDRPESGVVPVTIRVTEAALRTATVGAGARLDVLRLAGHLRLGWEHRNFLGGLRNFTATAIPGVTLFPTRIDFLRPPTRLLPENSLNLTLRQPSFLEGRTTGLLEVSYNIYPLLYPLTEGTDPERERIIGYNEVGSRAGLERAFWQRRVPITLSYNWRANFPFAYQGTTVEGLETVIVSYPELAAALDLRDHPIHTTSGAYISSAIQFANPSLGGLVTDVRIQPEARGYVPLDNSRRVVLAARAGFGFVFPFNYGETLDPESQQYVNLLLDPTNPNVVRDQHRLLFRAFYSGGPNSNRGYPYRRVGPHGPIGFLSPTGENCSVLDDGGNPRALPPACIRPLGGFSLWEASLELRFNVADPWSLVAFVDASNVSTRVADLNFGAPHVSVGPGVRYASPVGPIRLDVGWRVPGLQLLREQPGVLDVSQTPGFVDEPWYTAFAFHILIGEAF